MAADKKTAGTKGAVDEASPNFAPGDVGVTTPAGATIVAHNPVSKSELMKMINIDLASRSHEDLTDFFKKSIAQIGDEAVKVPVSDASHNKGTVEMKPSAATPNQPTPSWGPLVKEDLATVFEGSELSTEMQDKLGLIFEAQISLRVATERQKIEDEAAAALAAAVETNKQELAEQTDAYLEDMADQWAEDNKIAINTSLRNELVEDFMAGLKNLFIETNINVPEDKLDVLETLTDRVADLETKINESMNENVDLKKANQRLVAAAVFAEVSEGMVMTDIEKLKTLSESVAFSGDVDKLRKDLKIIKDASFKSAATAAASKKAAAGMISEDAVVTVEGVENEDGTVEIVSEASPTDSMSYFLNKQVQASKASVAR